MKIGMPKDGRFGDFGGKYIPETLVPAVEELEENYQKIKSDKSFQNEPDFTGCTLQPSKSILKTFCCCLIVSLYPM